MVGLTPGDRVRIDLPGGSDEGLHGRHGELREEPPPLDSGDPVRVAIDGRDPTAAPASALRPAPTVQPAFTARERETLTNVWGDGIPASAHALDTDELWEIRERVSQGVALCYEDDDMDALGVLLSIEVKITQVLGERATECKSC